MEGPAAAGPGPLGHHPRCHRRLRSPSCSTSSSGTPSKGNSRPPRGGRPRRRRGGQMVTGIQAAGEELGMEVVTGLEESAARQRSRTELDAYLLPEGLTEAAQGARRRRSMSWATSTLQPHRHRHRHRRGLCRPDRDNTTLRGSCGIGGRCGPEPVEPNPAEASRQPPTITIEQASAETRQLDQATYLAARDGLVLPLLHRLVRRHQAPPGEEGDDGSPARRADRGSRSWAGRRSPVSSRAPSSLVRSALPPLAARRQLGRPLGAFLLMVALSLAAVGIMSLVAGFAKTVEQAGALQGIVAVVLGLLGGSFFQFRQARHPRRPVAAHSMHGSRGLGDNVAEVRPRCSPPLVHLPHPNGHRVDRGVHPLSRLTL